MIKQSLKTDFRHKTPNDLDVVHKEGERKMVSAGFVRRPKILEDAGFDIYLDESKLKNLPVPVTKMELKKIEWMLDLPVWEKDGTDDWNLTPREVIQNKPDTGIHRKIIEDADLSYPIVIIFNKGRWIILDGFHRLAKACLLDKKTIEVQILTNDMIFYQDALVKP